jgi:hypothetical protein
MVAAKFFEGLLFFGVSFLVPRTLGFQLRLAPPEKRSHAVGVGILDAAFAQGLVGLGDRGDLAPFHGLFKLFPRFGRDQLLARLTRRRSS